MARTAVVLFNLGGPDSLSAVRPFLFNLFNDPAIIPAPAAIRWFLASMISRRRAPAATEIYRHLGGASPLLRLTRDQAAALEARLNGGGRGAGDAFKTFVAMRYWHPFAVETAAAVRTWKPDRVVLLPLYPQFSTTTTASSVKEWRRRAADQDLRSPTRAVCCYPRDEGLIGAYVDLIGAAFDEVEGSRDAEDRTPRLLLSAHGLPKKVIERGDPYQRQVETTVAAIVGRLGGRAKDSVVCYQSRVGPLQWIGPSIGEEIDRAGRDGIPLVVAPIAFVSEHSETLVELDIECRDRAREAGVPIYVRVPAVGTHRSFIAGLARMVERVAVGGDEPMVWAEGAENDRPCGAAFGECPLAGTA